MEILKESISWLNDITTNNNVVGKGGGSTVISYKDRLIKIPNDLYYLATYSSEKETNSYLKSFTFNHYYRINFRQMNYLINKQNGIKLTTLPKGALIINNKPCGVFLNYHRGYETLNQYTFNSKDEIYRVSYDLLLRIKELLINGIYQMDLHERNILIKKLHIELIDLEGMFIEIGNNKKLEETIYGKYWQIILRLFEHYLSIDEYQDFYNYYVTLENISNHFKKLDKVRLW